MIRTIEAPDPENRNADCGVSFARIDDASKAEDILPLVYGQLRKLAEKKLARESVGQTLQATALVHEAYLRLTQKDPDADWNGLPHFFGAAAMAMRRILVERARQKKTLRRGGRYKAMHGMDIDQIGGQDVNQSFDVLGLNEALDRLAVEHPRKVKLVELRFFLGLTNQEASHFLGISTSTADLDWKYARSWLKLEMDKSAK
ncbi:MAG: ECF-type sigma factor [Pirellulaceae bacterium]|nr:ECF-type sigma factor [Pirellulaceae bacterium]